MTDAATKQSVANGPLEPGPVPHAQAWEIWFHVALLVGFIGLLVGAILIAGGAIEVPVP